jgi:hypothetical protein
MSSPHQNQRTRGGKRFCPKAEGRYQLAQTMYTYISKCKKIKSHKKSFAKKK